MKKDNDIDAMLVTQYLDGDKKALSQLAKRWHKLFCAKAYWIVKDADVAKDIAQDSWKAIIDKIDTLKNVKTFGAWGLRIVYTKSLNYINSNNRNRKNLENYKYEQYIAIDENDSEESLKQALLKAIKSLVMHQQTVIKLFYVENYSLKEISEILNISIGTAKSRLFHAREKLKDTLKKNINKY